MFVFFSKIIYFSMSFFNVALPPYLQQQFIVFCFLFYLVINIHLFLNCQHSLKDVSCGCCCFILFYFFFWFWFNILLSCIVFRISIVWMFLFLLLLLFFLLFLPTVVVKVFHRLTAIVNVGHKSEITIRGAVISRYLLNCHSFVVKTWCFIINLLLEFVLVAVVVVVVSVN